MNPNLQTILAELKQSLTELYGDRLDRLILYGSQARGDAAPDSDVDVLVVLKGKVDPYEEIEQAGDIGDKISLEHDVLVSCVFVSSDRYRTERSPLLINANREGIAL